MSATEFWTCTSRGATSVTACPRGGRLTVTANVTSIPSAEPFGIVHVTLRPLPMKAPAVADHLYSSSSTGVSASVTSAVTVMRSANSACVLLTLIALIAGASSAATATASGDAGDCVEHAHTRSAPTRHRPDRDQ